MRSEKQIEKFTGMAKVVMKHHFGLTPKKLIHQTTGHTNFVFEVKLKENDYIIRISSLPEKINDFKKEQWVVALAAQKKIPVAEILEVGNEVIPHPYMIQVKLNGTLALHHQEKEKILHQMGKLTARIHKIPTSDFGQAFDWSENKLSKHNSWQEYLANELQLENRIRILEKNRMLNSANFKKFTTQLNKIRHWNEEPVLNHGDMRLKNIIVNEEAKIIAIIDWEESCSTIPPYWDLAIALHDLSIDEKHSFLDGYGLKPSEYSAMVNDIRVFNIINYTAKIESLVERNDMQNLEQYRMRLNGDFDLYSF